MANSGLNISGIYKIESKVHLDRIYIGSAVNFRQRRNGHFLQLKKRIHKNSKLQNHYNKYGENDLIFSVIVVCEKEELKPINGIVRPEQFFIWAYEPWFNICEIAGSSLDVKRSLETRKKIGDVRRGRPSSQKGKPSGIIPWNKGLTKETNETLRLMGMKISIDHKGKLSKRKGTKCSVESRKKMSESQMGSKDSEETRRRKSESAKKKPPVSQKTREKLRIINTGKKKPPIAEENRKNLSIAITEWWRKRKEKEFNQDVA